ncbi:MAG TPA: hypothetical protein VFX50_14495 [Gemmatimonadales bacterium]|nr:hypothetical protein [Gemmatimonadales bacterium]
MTRRIALGALVGGTCAIALAYASAFLPGGVPAWGPWCFLFGTATVMLATIVLGAARARVGVAKLAVPLAAIYALLLAGFGAVLRMPAETGADTALWLGLPPRAAIVMYAIGLLPLFVLPVAYALTFESLTLRPEDLARIEAIKAARLAKAREAGGGHA